MPPKKKEQKGKPETYYKPKTKKQKKRKVISPIQLCEQISRTKDCSGQSNVKSRTQTSVSVSPESDLQTQTKRFHSSAPVYFDFSPYTTSALNAVTGMQTAPNMNFSHMPYGASNQMMQSPPFSQPQFTGTMPMASSAPPDWATKIMEDIKSIKVSVSKIDGIEKLVNQINSKVENLETKMKSMDTRVKDVEKSSSFVSGQFEDQKTKLKAADNELKSLNKKCHDFEGIVKKLEEKNATLEEKTNDLEFRSLRENLLFHGIPEGQNENCETLVKQFVADKLDIGQEITIDRAHRLGKPKGRVRPIVVKFHEYTERETIRLKANDRREALKASYQGVGVQQTKAVLQKRRDMNGIYDREKAAGKTLKWAGARLLAREGDTGDFHEVTQ